MKKIIAMIMIFLFIASMISFAGIYTKNESSPSQYGSLYGRENSPNISKDESDVDDLKIAPSKGPENRPGNGGGIGQRSPIGNGLPVIFACCAVLVVVKLIKKKRK